MTTQLDVRGSKPIEEVLIDIEDFDFVLECLDQYLEYVPEHRNQREAVGNLIERWKEWRRDEC